MGISNFRNRAGYTIVLYLGLCLLIDIASRVVGQLQINNLILFSFLSFFEILIFSYLYWSKLKKSRWLQILTVLGLTYLVYEGLTLDQSDTINYQTYARNVSSLIIVLLVLKYIFSELKAGSTLKGETLHFILLSYYSLEFMLLIPFNFLINSSVTAIMYIWDARILLNFIFYAYLTFYLWSNGKTRI
ncbi:hypothetical protein BST97_15175 [Nonlabens spongiae]|uniref:Uncharacterized protein n=1 Tax=Nonlabens spongiae TaxID=331648 RepID=A0A1W6MNS1_9FLAO|nr:hypothetical protein BST97_15175 [Nonlabens spongiae]